MAQFPMFPLWTDAYLGDTGHLSTIEHGAYLLLLMTAWRTKDGFLPDDDVLLSRFTRLSPTQWKRIRPVVSLFFTIKDGKWIQPRLIDELNAVKRKSKCQSENGKARHLKNKETGSAKRQPNASQFQPTTTITTTISSKDNISIEDNLVDSLNVDNNNNHNNGDDEKKSEPEENPFWFSLNETSRFRLRKNDYLSWLTLWQKGGGGNDEKFDKWLWERLSWYEKQPERIQKGWFIATQKYLLSKIDEIEGMENAKN